MTRAQAADLIERYLGSFPSLNLHNPEVYVAELCSLLISYPLWAGEKTVTTLKHTVKFPATLAEAKPLLDENVRVMRYAAQWDDDAKKLVKDRALLAAPPTAPKPPKETYEELKARYGPNWGIDDPSRKSREMTRVQALAKLRAEFGGLVDMVPDQPEYGLRHVSRSVPDVSHQRETEAAE